MIGDLTVKSVSSFIEDNMYIQVEPSDEQSEDEENEGNKQIPGKITFLISLWWLEQASRNFETN